MLGDLLPSAMADKHRKKKTSNLLSSMKNDDGTIVNVGTGKGTVWMLATND